MASSPDGQRSDGAAAFEVATDLATSRRKGWALIRETLGGQRWGIAMGIGAGLVWTAAKVCTPLLVRQAMDRGIAGGDLRALVRWSGLVALAGAVSAVF